ncbi:MAG: CHAT domain-containing protein [Xanthomonadales bacterium]|jgi:hypothetical protein|nr:CHAT domain-containing protein [Xanthomonadales bacterium]
MTANRVDQLIDESSKDSEIESSAEPRAPDQGESGDSETSGPLGSPPDDSASGGSGGGEDPPPATGGATPPDKEVRFVLRGAEPASAENTKACGQALQSLFAVSDDAASDGAAAPVIQHFRLGSAQRDRSAKPPSLDLKATDLIRMQSDDGELWLTAEDFLEWPEIQIIEKRDGPPEIELASRSRDGGVFWKALTLVSGRIGQKIAKYGKIALARYLEKKVLAGNELFRWLPDQAWHTINSAPQDQSDKPWLLFIHGTFSSNEGSYAALWKTLNFKRLIEDYSGVLAFQHRTVSESPIDNLADLVPLLPSNAKFVVVGFSRGGLLTELLGRAVPVLRGGVAEPGIQDDAIEQLYQALIVESDAGFAKDQRKKLKAIVRTLLEKRIALNLQIPVGAAIYGTTLTNTKLSRQLTLWINLLQETNLDGALNPEAVFAVRLLSSAAEELLDISDLPGLLAMHPGGALVQFLRRYPSPVPTAALAAVADERGLRRPVAFLINSLFGVPNDWVVDRASMVPDAGANRWVGYQDVSEPSLYHITYMKSVRVQQLMKRTLERAATPALQEEQLTALNFEPVAKPVSAEARSVRPAPIDAPILFLLPGIMGTELYVKQDRVWLDKLQLLLSGMSSLRLNPDRATPGRPLSEYDPLIRYLEQHYRVVRFGYDWRKSLFDSARILDQAVRDELQRAPGRSVSFIAHSMGGMVVRAWMASRGSIWSEVSKNPNSRFLMLGTPTAGSHAMSKVLTGEERVLKLLAVGAASRRGLVEICGEYPGVLELLPEFGSKRMPTDDYFGAQKWDDLRKTHGYSAPSLSALTAALKNRKLLRRMTWPERSYYVAGLGKRTPIDVKVEENWFGRKFVDFVYTAEGDGRVPWVPGIPVGVKAWYVNVEHGDLASQRDLFDGYLEILQSGEPQSAAFKNQPLLRGSARSAGGRADDRADASEIGSLVDAGAFAKAALGSSPWRERAPAMQRVPRIRLIVSCADVASAAHPVMVGHYRLDGLHSAEQVLDQLLGGALQRSLDAGIHPQEIGEWRVFDIQKNGSSEKAVIVGLGEFGTLGISQLGRSLERAICGHIETRSQRGLSAPADLSSVLIGAGQGGVGVEPAIQTLLEALLRAAERCMQAGISSHLPEQFEIVELYSDRAHLAYHVLGRLLCGSARLRDAFELVPRLRHRNTGRRRAYADVDLSWAQRVRITGSGSVDGFPEKLDFELFSVLAKVNKINVDLNISLFGELLRQSSTHGPNLVRESVALYNALLPAEIKSARPSGERLLLIVDRRSAVLPWELLRPDLPSAGKRARGSTQVLPMSIAGGMVRQLSARRAPEYLPKVSEKTALIIADPLLGPAASAFWKASFGQLPAAEDEGRLVYHRLYSAGYQVAGPFREQNQITTGLFSDRVKILHIAGHGVFEFLQGQKKYTGLVLESGCFGPADVRQLPSVPELVFINCCHLGKLQGSNYSKLAANLAEAFIEVGARAVVAAGWAVDDQAALRFAEVFYRNMLDGRMFIDAVREARVAVYEEFPWDNTWGAYQCYGSDSYVLHGATDHEVPAIRHRDNETIAQCRRAYASSLDLRRTLIEPAIHRAMRAKTTSLASHEVDAVIDELKLLWAGTPRAIELNELYGCPELDLGKLLPSVDQIQQSAIPVSVHRALARLCDHAGRNLEAAIHAARAWRADQYGVNTRSLTRVLVGAGKGVLDLVERHGVGAAGSVEIWLEAASKYGEELAKLPGTTKRLHTLSQFHARTALALRELKTADKVLEHLDLAIGYFEEALQHRLTGVGPVKPSGSVLSDWCNEFHKKPGDVSRQRAIARSEVTANALVMCKLARAGLGKADLLEPGLGAYLAIRWIRLKSPLFWRLHARWQRRLLQNLIKDPAAANSLIDRYTRALLTALNRDPGHHHVGDVRYLLRFMLAFAKADGAKSEGKEEVATLVEAVLLAWNKAVRFAEA